MILAKKLILPKNIGIHAKINGIVIAKTVDRLTAETNIDNMGFTG